MKEDPDIECQRDAWEGDPEGLCLLHSAQENKNQKGRFNNAVKKKLAVEDYDFRGVFFPGLTPFFGNQEFKKDANFSGVTFSGDADFSGATFSGESNFFDATFIGDTDFSEATFSGDTDFSEATFSAEADFSEATFSGQTVFSIATFSKYADFFNATFSGQTYLTLTTFSYVNFSWATFSGEAHFREATFSEAGNFSSCLIKNKLVLDTINPAKKGESRKTFQAYLREIRFSDQGRLLFQDLSLAHATLSGTDLWQCRFNNVDWHPLRGRQAVYDEVRLYENIKDPKGEKPSKQQYARVEECYRYLKLNYEGAGDFKKAGDFHYGEMEMHRRGSPWRQWLPFSWHNLYRMLSGYGERPLRAFIWLLLLIPAWAVLVWGLGIDQAGAQTPVNYWQTLLFIFEKATLQRPPWTDMQNINWLGKLLASLSVLLLPGQAALFILALRNRLGRRR
jgi:uncharacterized protein YjbI with pentapeptide repeats